MSTHAGFPRLAALCAAVLALLAGRAPVADAQGLYYKEMVRGDRIYVFNVAANAERFEKTGEMAKAITTPRKGPNGETIVADNERALQLFYFKHGISEVVPEPPAPTPVVVWRDGKTRISTPNAYVELSNRVQVRYTYEDPDKASAVIAGTGLAGDPRGSFRIRRAKSKVEGWLLQSWLSYELQVNYPAVTGSNSGALLEDAAFGIDVSKGKGLVRVHVGQFKVPYGAQELTSATNQMFVERALVSNTLFRGRETGVALWGATPDNRLEWRVGVFNGNGPTRAANDNNKYQYNARVMWQPNGTQPLNQRAWTGGPLYSESDFESSDTPIYAVAFNWENQDNFGATAGNDLKWNGYGVDGIFKFRGVSVNAMYTFVNRTPEIGQAFSSSGGFVQAGKLFNRRRFEVGARYGSYEPSNVVGNDLVKEVRGVFSYYYARHGLKWQTDVGQIVQQGGPGRANPKLFELRSQLQFVF